jgi:hypothetical protein
VGISRGLDELTDLACTSRGEVAGLGCGGGARGLAEERQRVEPLRRDLAAARSALEALKAQTARTSAEAIAREARSGLARSHGLGISPGPRFAFATSLNSSFTEVYEFKQCGGAASGTHKMDKEGFSWIILLVALMVTGFLVISWPLWRLGETISRYLDFRWKSATARSRT